MKYSVIATLFFCCLISGAYGQERHFLEEQCYKYHHNFGTWAFPALDLMISSDYVLKGGKDVGDQPQKVEFDVYSISPDNSDVKKIWDQYYYAIERCNEVLYHVADEKIRAEALFVRAYAYFQLHKLFGAVPLITSSCLPVSQSLAQSANSDLYAQLAEDLNSAILNLPLKNDLAINKYTATNGAAKMLLADIYAFQSKWGEVEQLTDEIIASNQYSLLSNFDSLWYVDKEHNSESLFELVFNNSKGFGWDNFNWMQIEVNMYAQLMGPNSETVGLKESADVYEGWGFALPTQELVDFFQSNYDTVRLFSSVNFMDSILLKEIPEQNRPYQYTGYTNKKYSTRKANTVGPAKPLNYGQNIYVYRYAEVLLLNAEAKARLDKLTASLTPLNRVRERVKLPPIGLGALTPQEIIDTIFNERSLELAFEGKRYFDVIRFGKENQYLVPLGFKEETQGLWPIPEKVIAQNPGMQQNITYSSTGKEYPIDSKGNRFQPKINLPWAQNEEAVFTPDTMITYRYNHCMEDSLQTHLGAYKYDADSLMVEYNEFRKNDFLGKLTAGRKELYTYTSDKKLESICIYEMKKEVWDTISLHYIKYPSDTSLVDSLINFSPPMHKDVYVNNYSWAKDSLAYSKTFIYYTVDSKIDTNWIWNYKGELKRNNGELMEELIYKGGNNQSWQFEKLFTYAHKDGRLVKKNFHNRVNDTWVLDKSDTLIYEKGKLFEKQRRFAKRELVRTRPDTLRKYRYPELTSGAKSLTITRDRYFSLLENWHPVPEKMYFTTSAPEVVGPSGINIKYQETSTAIYPNPVLATCTISADWLQTRRFKLFAADGSVVCSGVIEGGKHTLDMAHLPQGVYTISIQGGKNQLLIKQ